MKNSCPWCMEPLPRAADLRECPHCGRSVGEGAEPQALNQRCQRVEDKQKATYQQMMMVGVPVVAVLGLVMPLLHFGVLVMVPLVVASHLVLTRVALVRDAQRLLGPARRMLNRWLTRFSFLWIGLPGYGAMTVPFAGALVGAGTFALLTSIAHVSTLVSLERERTGRKLALWEKLVPTVLLVLSIGLVLVLIGLAVVFGWSIMALADRLQVS